MGSGLSRHSAQNHVLWDWEQIQREVGNNQIIINNASSGVQIVATENNQVQQGQNLDLNSSQISNANVNDSNDSNISNEPVLMNDQTALYEPPVHLSSAVDDIFIRSSTPINRIGTPGGNRRSLQLDVLTSNKLENNMCVTPRRQEALYASIARTPIGEETHVYKYYCPLCMSFYKDILKSTCCGNYVCFPCCFEFLLVRGVQISTVNEVFNPQLLKNIRCPNCGTLGFSPLLVSHTESIRDYLSATPSNNSKWRVSSPIKIGDTFEDLKRKMVTYKDMERQNRSAHSAIPTRSQSRTSSALGSTANGIAMSTAADVDAEAEHTESIPNVTDDQNFFQEIPILNDIPVLPMFSNTAPTSVRSVGNDNYVSDDDDDVQLPVDDNNDDDNNEEEDEDDGDNENDDDENKIDPDNDDVNIIATQAAIERSVRGPNSRPGSSSFSLSGRVLIPVLEDFKDAKDDSGDNVGDPTGSVGTRGGGGGGGRSRPPSAQRLLLLSRTEMAGSNSPAEAKDVDDDDDDYCGRDDKKCDDDEDDANREGADGEGNLDDSLFCDSIADNSSEVSEDLYGLSKVADAEFLIRLHNHGDEAKYDAIDGNGDRRGEAGEFTYKPHMLDDDSPELDPAFNPYRGRGSELTVSLSGRNLIAIRGQEEAKSDADADSDSEEEGKSYRAIHDYDDAQESHLRYDAARVERPASHTGPRSSRERDDDYSSSHDRGRFLERDSHDRADVDFYLDRHVDERDSDWRSDRNRDVQEMGEPALSSEASLMRQDSVGEWSMTSEMFEVSQDTWPGGVIAVSDKTSRPHTTADHQQVRPLPYNFRSDLRRHNSETVTGIPGGPRIDNSDLDVQLELVGERVSARIGGGSEDDLNRGRSGSFHRNEDQEDLFLVGLSSSGKYTNINSNQNENLNTENREIKCEMIHSRDRAHNRDEVVEDDEVEIPSFRRGDLDPNNISGYVSPESLSDNDEKNEMGPDLQCVVEVPATPTPMKRSMSPDEMIRQSGGRRLQLPPIVMKDTDDSSVQSDGEIFRSLSGR